jgi:V/A-type H+-transporting ATPase subunit I
MFRPAKIHHTTLILGEDKVNKLINRLYELGICELKEATVDLSSKYSYEVVKNLDEIQTRFNVILESLEEYKEVVQPGNRLKNLLSPEAPKKHKSEVYPTKEIIEDVEYHLGLIEPKVLDRLDRLQEIKEEIQKNEFIISNLSLIPEIRTELFRSTENIRILLGLISTASLAKIKEEFANKEAVMITKEKDKTLSFVTALTSPEELPNVDKILHAVGFETLDIPFESKTPTEIINSLRKDISKLEDEKRKIDAFLAKTWKLYEEKFAILSEELEIAKQKIIALQNFKTTEAISVLEAWVPEKDFDKFHAIVKETSKQYYMEVDEKDDAPTLFKNSKWVRPFEMITELYSPPKYKDFDPTPIIAITFTLFFGFMLTDAAYGLILLVLGWIMYRGVGKFNESMKGFAMLLMMFGVSTTLLGMVFGSYFGNFFQDIGINLPIPIDSMRQVMLTLGIALGLGSLHLIIGLVSGFYENIHKGSLKDAMATQGVWLIFMVGLFLFLLKLSTLGLIAILLAVVLQMYFNFLAGGLVSSLLSVFGFSGYIGDLFAYARLMALAIGTAGISLAVNFMVFMVIDMIPWVGVLIAIVVFIVGHLFNVVMNGLGAFIHTTRLHFLEFFTKFYEGGGRTYKPFLAERKSTFVKLEGGT